MKFSSTVSFNQEFKFCVWHSHDRKSSNWSDFADSSTKFQANVGFQVKVWFNLSMDDRKQYSISKHLHSHSLFNRGIGVLIECQEEGWNLLTELFDHEFQEIGVEWEGCCYLLFWVFDRVWRSRMQWESYFIILNPPLRSTRSWESI